MSAAAPSVIALTFSSTRPQLTSQINTSQINTSQINTSRSTPPDQTRRPRLLRGFSLRAFLSERIPSPFSFDPFASVENPTHLIVALHAVFASTPTQALAFPCRSPPAHVKTVEKLASSFLTFTSSPSSYAASVPLLETVYRPYSLIVRHIPRLSTLPPTTVTTTRNISTFILFLRSVLAPSHRPHQRFPRRPCTSQDAPEIHSPRTTP